MAMNWVGGTRARTKSSNASSTNKTQKAYFARIRNVSLSRDHPSILPHASFPDSTIEPNVNIHSISLAHSPFAGLHRLESEQREEERVGSKSVAGSVKGKRGVDIVSEQDEEDVLAWKVAKRKRRELMERIGDGSNDNSIRREDSMWFKGGSGDRSTMTSEGGRGSSVVSSVSRANDTFEEKKRRLLGRSDWLGLSKMPKIRDRSDRYRQEKSVFDGRRSNREDTEGVYELEEGTEAPSITTMSGALPVGHRYPPPPNRIDTPLHRTHPQSTIGSQSLLIEVGNKRAYIDRRGNEEVESVYSDGEEAESSLYETANVNSGYRKIAPEASTSLPHSEFSERPVSSHSFKSTSDEDLVAAMDEILASGSGNEGNSQARERDGRRGSSEYEQEATEEEDEEDHDEEEYIKEEDPDINQNIQTSPYPQSDRPDSQYENSAISQLRSFLYDLNQTSQPVESQDSVFVELRTPDPSQPSQPSQAPTVPILPHKSPAAMGLPKLGQPLAPQISPFFAIPEFLLSTTDVTKPLDTTDLLRDPDPKPETTSDSSLRLAPDKEEEDIRRSDFWDRLNENRRVEFEMEDPACSMIAEASVLDTKDEDEAEGDDEWAKFMCF